MIDLAQWLDTPGAGLVLLAIGLGVLSGAFGGFTVLDALQTISRAQARKYGVSGGGKRSGDGLGASAGRGRDRPASGRALRG